MTIRMYRTITVLRLNLACYYFLLLQPTSTAFYSLIALVDMFICTSLVNNVNLLNQGRPSERK